MTRRAGAREDHVTAARDEVVIRRGRVLVMSTMRVVSGDRVLGTVTTMRDRTALADLEREIGSFRSTAHVLRAQAHEFANQLHTISGLIQLGELEEVVRYVDALSERRHALDLTLNTLVRDPTIAALLMAKVATANERRVELTISDETTLERLEPGDAADVATVRGEPRRQRPGARAPGARRPALGACADPPGREHRRDRRVGLRPGHPGRPRCRRCSSTGSRPSVSTRCSTAWAWR